MELSDRLDGEPEDQRQQTGLPQSSVITENDITRYFDCPYAFYLSKFVGLNKLSRSAYAAESMLFQNTRRQLYRVRDEKIGRVFPDQNRAGPHLKMAEEMDGDELRKYLAVKPGSLGNLLRGKWFMIGQKESYAGTDLLWGFPSQVGADAMKLKKAGDNYQSFVYENGAPILGFIEKDIPFDFEGTTFIAKLPEVRRGLRIDDPSLWGRSEGQLDITALRILGFCTLANESFFYRMKWHVPDAIADAWGGAQKHIGDEVMYRTINCVTGEVTRLQRSDANLDGLKRSIEHFKEGVLKENYEPNHQSCISCAFNCIDTFGNKICAESKKGVKANVPMYFFRKSNFDIECLLDEGLDGRVNIKMRGMIQKNECVKRTVAKYLLTVKESEQPSFTHDDYRATSRYWSNVRGIEFEQRMIAEADRQLIALSNQRNWRITHHIDFEGDFKFAGQRKISELISQLGYRQFEKIYLPGQEKPRGKKSNK